MTFHSIPRTIFAVCALSCIFAGAARADGLWQAGDTVFRLQASGLERSLLVEQPSAEAAAQGLTAGTVVFRGRRDGGAYVGMAYGGDCAAEGVPAQGRIVTETTVVLTADGAACGGLSGGALELRFIGKVSGAAAVAAVAPAPEPAAGGDDEAAAEAAEQAQAQAEAEAKAQAKAEAKAKAEAEAQARAEAKAKARAEAEAKAQARAEARARAKAEAQAKKDAEAKARAEARAAARAAAKAEAKAEAEAKAQATAAEKAAEKAAVEAVAAAQAVAEAQAQAEAQVAAEVEAAETDMATAEAEAAAEVAAPALAVAETTAPKASVPLVVPAKACLSKAVAQKVNLAACRGLLAGARLNAGADPQAEADRNEQISAGGGAGSLYPAVDASCYANADLDSYQAGVELAQAQPVVADTLSPMCLDALAAAYAVPAAGLVAALPQTAGSIASQVWTKAGAGKSCKGANVLRLSGAGMFQGRFGAEKAIYNGSWLNWSDDGAVAQGRMEVHSEILTAPDMVIEVSAERVDAALAVTMVVQRVTPQSRYSSAPEYSAEKIVETYYPCAE